PKTGSQRPRSEHISRPQEVSASRSHSAVQVPSEPQYKPLLQSRSRAHDLSQADPYSARHTPSKASSRSIKSSGTLPQRMTNAHAHTIPKSTPARGRGYFVVVM